MSSPSLPLWICAFSLFLSSPCSADGFRLSWALEHEPHVVIHLTAEQIATVGRERKLVLTDSQWQNLRRFSKNLPRTLGVETPDEPDCSCCISSAFWTATGQVTIWLQRLAGDRHGSKWYYETRMSEGYFTADAQGRIYAAGKLVPWAVFETAVKSLRKGEYAPRLALPPDPPKEFSMRIAKLAKAHRLVFGL